VIRELLEGLETEGADPVSVAWLAGSRVAVGEDELRGSLRRAVLLLATGGDPLRDLDLDGRAVTALAGELDRRRRREELHEGLTRLDRKAAGLPRVEQAIGLLLREPELAWRAYAAGLLAEELAG